MPKVISYTPPWLSRPSPGASLFSSSAPKDPGSLRSPKGAGYLGPSRTLARRGNEVFTVVDNQIRWSSLTRLKDEWQQRARSKNQQTDADGVPYRVSIGVTIVVGISTDNGLDSGSSGVRTDPTNYSFSERRFPGNCRRTHRFHCCSSGHLALIGIRQLSDPRENISTWTDDTCHLRVTGGIGTMAPAWCLYQSRRLSGDSNRRCGCATLGAGPQ